MAESPSRRIGRMLTLVPWLTARPGITMEETAEHFDVSVETLEADLWQIILCGIPGYGPDQLVDIDFWDDGAIFVHDPQTLTAPLRLSPEETAAILLGLHTLTQTPGVSGMHAVLSAAAKLEAALEVEQGVTQVVTAHPTSRAFVENLDRVIASGGSVRMEYGSADGQITERIVWPQHALTVDGVLYINGWCELAEASRTFRVDRILALDVLPGSEAPPAPADASWWDGVNTHRARVRVRTDRAWALDEATNVVIVGREEGWIEAEVGFANVTWITGWALRHPGFVIVIDPTWVVEAVRDRTDRLLASPVLARG